jgi:hypothetical protein
MGLRHYWLFIIAAQFVLQALVLTMLLLSLARRRGNCQARPVILKVLGWVVLVPILGVTVLVLMNASWEALWSSCIAVSLCGGFFACLTLDSSELTPRHLRELDAERAARKARTVARYQKIAGELDRIAPQVKPQPRPAPGAPVEPETPVRAAAGKPAAPLHLESRIPLADRMPPEPVATVNPVRVDIDWRIARSLIKYEGSVRDDKGDQVLLINGKLYQQHDVMKAICNGTAYHWFIVKGDPDSLDLKRLNSCSLSAPAP